MSEIEQLRADIRALADEYDREADWICPPGQYDSKDKAWRVAHVRRRVASDLRALTTPPTAARAGTREAAGTERADG